MINNHLFWVKNNDKLEWRDAGRIPVYYFEAGEPVTVSKINQLVSEVSKATTEGERTSYAFIIFHDRLGDGVTRRLWELKRSESLIIIPIHAAEIKQISSESRTSQGNLAYSKLVALRRQWSILTDPYASISSLADPQWFFGRPQRAIIQRILSEMSEGATHFVVYGMRRVGKTTLLNQIARICQERGYAVVTVLCEPFLRDENSVDQVLGKIIEGWQNALQASYSTFPPLSVISAAHQVRRKEIARHFKSKFMNLDKAIQEYIGSAVKLVLILDEVDQIFPNRESPDTVYYYYCQFTQALKNIIEIPGLATTVSIVAAMEYPSIHLVDRFSYNEQFQNPLYGRFRLKPVTFLPRDDWDEMVQMIGDLVGLIYTEESLDVFYYYSSGHPEITRKLGSCLIELRDNNGLSSPITPEHIYLARNHFLENRSGYSFYLETTFWKDPLSVDLDTEQRVMELLAEEEELSESDLYSRLLKQYEGIREERGRVTNSLERLVDLQIIEEGQVPKTYTISIPLYRDWIRREILSIEVETQ